MTAISFEVERREKDGNPLDKLKRELSQKLIALFEATQVTSFSELSIGFRVSNAKLGIYKGELIFAQLDENCLRKSQFLNVLEVSQAFEEAVGWAEVFFKNKKLLGDTVDNLLDDLDIELREIRALIAMRKR